VDNPTTWVDFLGLASHPKPNDPSAPHPDYPGRRNDGKFLGTNPEAVKGQDYHKKLSKKLEKKGFTTGKRLPGSQKIPDGHKVDKNGFITDVAEVKPDTRSGKYKMEGQINGYSDSARGYNKNLSNTTGRTAPAVKQHRIFYSPETGEISRWLS
jgi:hypothetical protein